MSLEDKFTARADYEYQGGDTVFSVPFSYINKSHIVVIVDKDEENPITDFEWLSEHEIRINCEINQGVSVSIRRVTPIKNKLVKFTDNNILDEETQNLAQDQVINVVQEVKDSQASLVDDMNDFVNIKDAVQENMNALEELKQRADDVVEFDKEVKETFDGISSTYEDLKAQVKNGLNVQSNKNLFSLEVTDRTLDENELSGLCEQGKSFSADVYPDAYSKILNEYEQGEEKVFTSEEDITLVKRYGQTEGNYFYTQNVDLADGVMTYNDINLSEEKGVVSNYGMITSKEYLTNNNDKLYIAEDEDLAVGTHVYDAISLIVDKGAITSVKDINAYEYTLSTSGKVYYPTSMTLLKGRPMYSDITMDTVKGIITKLETIKADKYAYNDVNGEEQIFYVPEGTVLAQGTQIYSNPELTISSGSITSKGSQSSKHYYKMVCGTGYGSAVYFYTKTAIPTSSSSASNTYLFKDAACTKKVTEKNIGISQYDSGQLYIKYLVKNTNSDTKSKYPFRAGLYPTVHNILWVEVLITLISSATAQNYICINDDTFKCGYHKQGTVEAEIISLDNGANESYSLTSMVENTAIKINDGEYELVSYQGLKTALAFKIGGSSYQNFIGSLISTSGLVIPYKEYSNGHKIVSSQYENALLSYKENHNELTFYMLDTENRTVTVPILDSSKNIYFCVGNTMIARSAIQPVDKAYVDTNFATKEYVEGFLPKSLLESLGEIVLTYNETLGEIEGTLGDILGETE